MESSPNPISAGISVLPIPPARGRSLPHHGRPLAGHALGQTQGVTILSRVRARSAAKRALSSTKKMSKILVCSRPGASIPLAINWTIVVPEAGQFPL